MKPKDSQEEYHERVKPRDQLQIEQFLPLLFLFFLFCCSRILEKDFISSDDCVIETLIKLAHDMTPESIKCGEVWGSNKLFTASLLTNTK